MTNTGSKPCLKLGIGTYLPYMVVTGPDDNPTVRGSQPAVLDIIFNYLGYCYEYVVEPSRAGGIRLPNGTWTGVIGLLLRGGIDMTGVGMALTHDRYQDLDATDFLYIDGWSAGFQRPVLQSDISGFVKPFSEYLKLSAVFQVWLLIAAAIVGVLVTTWFVHMSRETIVTPRTPRAGGSASPSGPERHGTRNVTEESVLWTIAVFLAQSVTKLPRGNSVRVMTGVWLLVSLILITVYRSNLKAMLILPKVVLPFDSPEELAETRIPTWIPRGSAMHTAGLKSPPESALAKILEHSNSLDVPTDVSWGINDMISGKHAMTSPRASLTYIMHTTFSKKRFVTTSQWVETGQCLLYTMSEDLVGMVQVSILLRKGSPLKAELDPVIRRLREFGILDHEYKKQVANATECLKPIGSRGARQLRPLDLGDFYGVFMLYAGGALMALASFLMELVLHNAKHSVELDSDFKCETAEDSTPSRMKLPNNRTHGLDEITEQS
ncbi:glutamate receptor ionotropic, delta-2-like [Penaeus monodon]|uniref:glutamate receptor ionotropic, delta-2-like n=1 Tax=Penaeus monodon TaxID=6687 RepID=UPI0018A7C311|nr:glutamate receptor ionotropic, delta-2-like [Penaeus monodon]